MEIHGIRIYPQTVTLVPGVGAPIFLHGRLDEHRSDLEYLFGPLQDSWKGHYLARAFGITIGEDRCIEDILPYLRNYYGTEPLSADFEQQLLTLPAESFRSWARKDSSQEGYFLPVFRDHPSMSTLRLLYWDLDYQLASGTWPEGLRSIVHNWDDMYWQYFSVDRSDVETLIEAHRGDPKLKLYWVELDREYPDPSDQELVAVR